MTDSVSVPPGWYAGGVAGEERWWDGAAWTGHVRSSAAPLVWGVRWAGNADASLVVGIIVALLALPAFGVAFLTLHSGGFLASLLPGFAGLVFLVLGALAIVNSFGVRRQDAWAAARAGSQHVPPTA